LATTHRSTQRLPRTKRYTIARALVFSLIIGLPAIGLFSLQWSLNVSSPYLGSRTSLTQPSLSPRQGIHAYESLSSDQNTTAAAAVRFAARGSRLSLQARQSMVAPSADPFYEAFSGGISEGLLVLHSTEKGVPTFRPPRSERRSAPVSDQALLNEIRIELGGSFENFLENVLGGSAFRGGLAFAESSQKNPFVKLADTTQSVQTGAQDATASSSQETTAKTAPEEKQDAASGNSSETSASDSQPTYSAGPFGIIRNSNSLVAMRSHVLMHVNANGTLQAYAALLLRGQTIETAEMGARQFNLLSFSRPAESASALAAADLDGNGNPDVCFLDSLAGVLHFYYGAAGGTFVEGMRVDVGAGPRSIAAGDFNLDGRTDVAISNVGVGTLTLLYLGNPGDPPVFKSAWLDAYRDAIMAADTTGSGIADLIGISFPNLAQVLDIGRPGKGAMPGKSFTSAPALERKVSVLSGYQLQLSATLLKSNLAINLQNYQNQMVNVVNVQAGADIFVLIGDFNYENAISIALATLQK
jgi:hypothetical protein